MGDNDGLVIIVPVECLIIIPRVIVLLTVRYVFYLRLLLAAESEQLCIASYP